MVSGQRLALNPVDWLLAGYLGFVTLVILVRGDIFTVANAGMLTMHALYGVLLFLFTRLTHENRAGRFIHDLYPVLFLVPFYAQFSLINPPPGTEYVLEHDAILQRWEEALFGGQIAYTWIREAPSVFWSGTFYLAYFMYYPIVSLPIVIWLQGREQRARNVVFPVMVTFVMCYAVFILWPAAGPYYTFEHPTGPVREVWSARIVFGLLANGSSFGAAFPSSHVAATLAATLGLWRHARTLGIWFTVPCILLIIGTVYGQMHYGVDAAAGIVFGLVGFGLGTRVQA